jgi:hypothetical protein
MSMRDGFGLNFTRTEKWGDVITAQPSRMFHKGSGTRVSDQRTCPQAAERPPCLHKAQHKPFILQGIAALRQLSLR